MSIRVVLCIFSVVALGAAPGAAGRPRAVDLRVHSHEAARYQGRGGPEQTERFSRRIRLGRDGRVSISNISGDITITGGSGDELSIEAVKRTRGDRSQLS